MNCPTKSKQAFQTKADAIKAAHAPSRATHGMILNAYKCQCGKFHIGKAPRVK